MRINNPWRSVPFFRMLVPLILGIVVQHHYHLRPFWCFLLALVSLAFIPVVHLFLSKIKKQPLNWIFGSTLSVFLFFAGIALTHIEQSVLEQNQLKEQHIECTATVVSQPKEKPKSVSCTIKCNIADKEKPITIKAYINKSPEALQLKYGDMIYINSKLENIENAGNPYEFDYKKYLQNKGIYHSVYLKDDMWLPTGKEGGNLIIKTAERFRTYLLQQYAAAGINGREYAVISALTLGYKNELDEETKQIYSSSGAMHILAVSGLHVGIILILINVVFSFFYKNHQHVLFFVVIKIILLWAFATITGLAPSVIRAATMLSFVEIGRLKKHSGSTYNTLSASAFFILIFSPLSILEIGFQLSYLAVLAIVTIHPILSEQYLPENHFHKKIYDLLSVSIAAQIGTFPISILYFHQFPNYFFITNLFAIPLAFAVVVGGMLLLSLSWITPLLPVLGKILSAVCYSLNWLNEGVSRIPYSTTQNLVLSNIETITIYLVITMLTLYILNYNKAFLFACVSFVTIYAGLGLMQATQEAGKTQFVVYNTNKQSLYNIVSTKQNIVFATSKKEYNLQPIKYTALNNWIQLAAPEPEMVFLDSIDMATPNTKLTIHNLGLIKTIRTKNKTIAIANTNSTLIKQIPSYTQHNITIDYLVVNKKLQRKLSEILMTFTVKNVIVDNSVSKKDMIRIQEQCSDINIHYTLSDGAYVVKEL